MNFILKIIRDFSYDIYYQKSYSQEGEDLIIHKFFNYKDKGYYIDIGAHHPKKFSNTCLLYDKGWSGINYSYYYIFNEPAVNTFSEIQKDINLKNGYFLLSQKKIKIVTLSSILEKYSEQTKIDFLNIDVEGLDYEILDSNNWDLFKPTLVCIEIQNSKIDDLKQNKIYKFLIAKSYKLIAITGNSHIFQHEYK